MTNPEPTARVLPRSGRDLRFAGRCALPRVDRKRERHGGPASPRGGDPLVVLVWETALKVGLKLRRPASDVRCVVIVLRSKQERHTTLRSSRGVDIFAPLDVRRQRRQIVIPDSLERVAARRIGSGQRICEQPCRHRIRPCHTHNFVCKPATEYSIGALNKSFSQRSYSLPDLL